MANTASAKKRARQNEVRRNRNMAHRSKLRTFMKKVRTAIANKDKDTAVESYKLFVPIIDRASNRGIIHKNKAARHKRILNAQLRAL